MADELQIKPFGGDAQTNGNSGSAPQTGQTSATSDDLIIPSLNGQPASTGGTFGASSTGSGTNPANQSTTVTIPTTQQPATSQPVNGGQTAAPIIVSPQLTDSEQTSPQSTAQTDVTLPTVATQQGDQSVVQGQTAQQTATQPSAQSGRKVFNLADELEEENSTLAPPEKYAIPSIVKEKFPDLIELIKSTESMSDDEREYWFQILPIMTEEQITKFRDILVNEKEQLAKLDSEYEEELNRLNEKHMIEWKEFEAKEKRRALTQAEEQASNTEKQTEEDLLAKLSQI